MKYFTISRIKEAIQHLEEYRSTWVIVPLVLASNGINGRELTSVDDAERVGTTRFLNEYFSGNLIGLPPFDSGHNTLRPKFRELKNSLVSESDWVLHQRVNLWGSAYSSRGYREMRNRGELSGDHSDFKLESGFKQKFESELPSSFRFEELLVWLYAFCGLPDKVSSWSELIDHFQVEKLRGTTFSTEFTGRFNVNNQVPWPPEFLNDRPSNEDLQAELLPSSLRETTESIVDFSGLKGELLNGSFQNSPLRGAKKSISRTILSLASKPFLILTGLSGSGKTKIAQALSTWLGHDASASQVVPVGADWTSREQLLGYPDGLREDRYVKQAALKLILEASKPENKDKPHFLILDEMNLSHVERYFSDFLSAIESDEAIPMHEEGEYLDGVPSQLELPRNLFVIGTVNVDETTYLFSPKVLDRANVIEFRVKDEDFDAFLEEPKRVDLDELCEKDADGKSTGVGLGKDYGPLLVQAVSEDVEAEQLGDAHDGLKQELGVLFRVFQHYNWEFGYRTGKEVSRFVYFHHQLTGEDWAIEQAIDAQIVQKLMPKLSGSEDRLRKILMALAWYTSGLIELPEQEGDEAAKDYYQRISKLIVDKVESESAKTPDKLKEVLAERKPRYELAFDKTVRMWLAVRQNGFTSFAEN